MTDHITILTHNSLRLAKLWSADGKILPYDTSKNYSVTTSPVTNLQDLSRQLIALEADPHSAVIRGKFKGNDAAAQIDPEEHKPGLARKILALYDDLPLHWVLIEVDSHMTEFDPLTDTEAALTEYITTCLPSAFHDISYHWQLSSSAGHPSAAGKLKAHLWFWLAQPATSEDLKRWADTAWPTRSVDGSKAPASAIDKSVLNAVQFHYTAAPLAEPGVVIPVVTRSGFFDGMWGDEVVLDFTRTGIPSASGAVAVWGDDDLMGLTSRLDWTLEYGRSLLFDINPDSDRATWVNDLAALHHEFAGSEAAFAVAVEWSSTASNFSDEADVRARWESFGKYRGGTPMTGRWLLKRRGECMSLQKYVVKDEWIAAIKNATDEFSLREKVCPEIVKDGRVDAMAREALAQTLAEAFKRLGTKYPLAQCRKLIAEKRITKVGPAGNLPDWAQGWCYVTNEDQFFRVDSEEWLSMQGFNARFNRELTSIDDEGSLAKSAAWVALEDLELEAVTKAVYLPWAGSTFELAGVKCVNKYRPSTTPTAVLTLSPAGKAAVGIVLRHLDLLAGGRPEVVATMIDWLAHNVQHPGVKIRWSPLIKGIEGDGKTLLGSLLAAVMGRVNVRNISSTVLGTDFTGWAEGAAVGVLEEIKLTGHNRYDILNALKPFITNDSIEVHPKGQPSRDSINTTNYIAFTNHDDALPLTDTDRRWWVIFIQFATAQLLAAAVADVAPDLGAYFDRLHEAIQQHPAELRRWLLDHPISSSFKPNGNAPMTYEKTLMIGLSSTDEEDTIRDILEHCEGVKGVSKNLFASRCMGAALASSDAELSLNTTSRNRLFSKVGFSKLPKKVKWEGESHTIWIKGHKNLEPAVVREILDETLTESNKGSDCDDLF